MPVTAVNGSFEEPFVDPNQYYQDPDVAGIAFFPDVPGWNTTENEKIIEIWTSEAYKIIGNEGTAKFTDGNQGAEVNSYEPAALYQDFATTPGQKIYYSVDHGARGLEKNAETLELRFGIPNNSFNNTNKGRLK